MKNSINFMSTCLKVVDTRRGDVSFYDEQLLFRGVVVGRDDAPGGRFHDGGGGPRF